MPSLILSARFTSDSQRLRKAADQLGWQTVRIDGRALPDWFEPPDDALALFYTPPHAFDIAQQLGHTLLGCNPDWLLGLPVELTRRHIRQMTLREALELPGRLFVKHAVSKGFPAAVYDNDALREATAKVLPDVLVHVAEPIEWLVEYRCFVLDNAIAALSPYRRYENVIEDHVMDAPPAEVEQAAEFASTVLRSAACPPAFVLDVGLIAERGWAVVECNECWASGIYACAPTAVLTTLLRACVPTDKMSDTERHWDFRTHYFTACK